MPFGQFLFASIGEKRKAMRQAIADGCDVMGFIAWSAFDVVSNSTGEMSKRHGFVYVDIDDEGNGTGRRIPKSSYEWYREVIRSKGESL